MPILKADPVRRSIPRSAAKLLAGIALASSAGTALAGPRSSGADLSAAPSVEDRRVLLGFARCVVRHEPGRARTLILGDYTSDAYRNGLRRLADAGNVCLPPGSRLRFGGVLLAGNLAETLLVGVAPRGTLANRVAFSAAVAPFRAYDQTEVASICVVRAAPAETEALLATAQGSAEETAALGAIMPQLAPCLASGVELRLNRSGLRAALALAAYRLVQHNATAVAAAGN